MKIKTLESRLKKINSKLENNKFFVTNRTGRVFEIKILKNHDSDDIDAFAMKNTGAKDIIFDKFLSLVAHIYN